jgi:UDP-glucose 4-epimerase
MIAILFGSKGFLGRQVLGALKINGFEVIEVSNLDMAAASAPNIYIPVAPDVVINCIARVPKPELHGINDLETFLYSNVLGTRNVVRLAVEKKARAIINCSTLAVVQRPWPVPLTESTLAYPIGEHAGYAVSKLAGEIIGSSIAIEAGIPLANLRLAALYGRLMPWRGVMCRFIDAAIKGKQLEIEPEVSMDFMHIGDAALAVVASAKALLDLHSRGIINVASGREIYIKELAELILIAAGRNKSDVVQVESDISGRSVIDTTRLTQELNYHPRISIENGIKEMVSHRLSIIMKGKS